MVLRHAQSGFDMYILQIFLDFDVLITNERVYKRTLNSPELGETEIVSGSRRIYI